MTFMLATDRQIGAEMRRRCRKERLLQNMTQADLARRAGIGVATIRRFESDADYSPTLETFIRIARHLGGLDALEQVLRDRPLDPFTPEAWERQRARPTEMPAGWTWEWGDEE